MEQDVVREKLKMVSVNFGIKIKFLAKKLDWDYPTMIKFKNGQADYSSHRLNELNELLNTYK